MSKKYFQTIILISSVAFQCGFVSAESTKNTNCPTSGQNTACENLKKYVPNKRDKREEELVPELQHDCELYTQVYTQDELCVLIRAACYASKVPIENRHLTCNDIWFECKKKAAEATE